MKWLELLKKIKLNNTLIVIVLILLSWIFLREMKIDRIGKNYKALDSLLYVTRNEREVIQIKAVRLQRERDSLQLVLDSANKQLLTKKEELYFLKLKHQREIDSLLDENIPVDTIYIRAGYMYPNDGGALEFPFSGSQVRQIYSVGLQYPRIASEYKLQSSLLNSCFSVNAQHAVMESNLNSQISNLNDDIMLANKEISIQASQMSFLQKKVRQKSFWNIVLEITTFSGWLYAAFK